MPSRLFNVRNAFGEPINENGFTSSRGPSLRTKDDIEVGVCGYAIGRALAGPDPDRDTPTQVVWYRKDFGTPGGWREIRGVQAAEVNTPFELMPNATVRTRVRHVRAAWYLDELGKLERYRRQICASAHSCSRSLDLRVAVFPRLVSTPLAQPQRPSDRVSPPQTPSH